MTPSRNKPGVAFWATVVVVAVLVLYPLSIGPNIWLADRGVLADSLKRPLRYFYYPLAWVVLHSAAADNVYQWYAELWGHEFKPEPLPVPVDEAPIGHDSQTER